MSERDSSKYEAISKIIRAPADPAAAREHLAAALESAMVALEIKAASLAIFDKQGNELLYMQEGNEAMLAHLDRLEQRMLGSLREQFKVESLYTTLDDDGLKSLFSYLIKIGNRKLGTISGICEGSRNIALEHEFIEVMALALRGLFGRSREIQDARDETVKQVAAALGDKINNPVQAVLLAVQLLQESDKLSPADMKRYLSQIEKSSVRIGKVIRKLMNLAEARAVPYLDGTMMLDFDENEDEEEGKK